MATKPDEKNIPIISPNCYEIKGQNYDIKKLKLWDERHKC